MDYPPLFPLGARVRIEGHWEWPDGTVGTIAAYPSAIRALLDTPESKTEQYTDISLRQKSRTGFITTQWVVFDRPTDDGSGDGPYKGGGVDVNNLFPEEQAPSAA